MIKDKDHPIENLMTSTMENLKDMIDVNTIIGTPVETQDGTCIIPISRVSFGFASGGSEFDSPNKTTSNTEYPFAGGSGAGVSVKPVSFLVVRKDSVRLLPVEQDSTYDRIVDTVPQILEMFKDVCKEFKGNKCKSNDKSKNATVVDDEFIMSTNNDDEFVADNEPINPNIYDKTSNKDGFDVK
ncbi:GerW family sporulation protein [uncultured Clostridium sp.]|uniref:GerW family sporulation protein n=1 Tax=uncultured Clostridium sp. TaxID=59620 RepID=UPI0026352C30|nr:GerW family sporulation protein [uncultured Clostridium sp.]